MSKYKETWFSSIVADSLTIPKKKALVKYIKVVIGILLFGVFLFLATLPNQTSEHSFYIDSEGIISNNLSQQRAQEEGLTLVATREETSFLNLSAGCVGKTEWLYPKAGGSPILTSESSSDKEYLASKDWVSIPPVRGDHSLNPNIPTQRFSPQGQTEGQDDWLSYSDALNLLYQGHYVIWYSPQLIESDPSTYNQMSNYILDKILAEDAGGPRYYLAALPEYRLEELPRSIYFTKLNYTQSCVKFQEEIFDNFYGK